MEMRKCASCRKELSVDNFSINPKIGELYKCCNSCIEQMKFYYEANKEQRKVYYEANKEKILEKKKAYREANKEKIAEQMKAYREANKEQRKAYREANKEKIAERRKAYYEVNKEKIAERRKAYREANKEKIVEQMKAYYEANKEKIAEQSKSYYEANKEQRKAYNETNKEKIAERRKAYYEVNKEKIAEQMKSYNKVNKEQRKAYREANKEKIAEQMKFYRKEKALYNSYKDIFFGEFKEGDNGVLLVKCKYCNKWFSPTNSEAERYIHRGNSLYCSDGCKKSCPTYHVSKHEKGFRQNTSREVQPELRKLVLERDNWTCQKCGANKNEDITVTLHCHHIDPVKNNPIESADMDNCVILCKACHKEAHSRKGCRYSDLASCNTKE